MSTAPTLYPAAQPLSPTRSLAAIFLKETKYEFLKLLRTRTFSFSVIGFPVMFYLLFGVANRTSFDGNVHVAKAMLGGYACFGLIGAALFGIGVGMAAEINAGWLEVKRASPMPPLAYLVAKLMTAVAFGLIVVAVLIAIGVSLGGVSITASEIARMLALTSVGAVVFACMGLLIAQIVPANSAPGIVNLIYLPMSFVSGLWMPFRYLPHWVQKVAPIMPTYHLAQLMLRIFGPGYYLTNASVQTHWFGLIGFGCLTLGASWAVFNRTQRNS